MADNEINSIINDVEKVEKRRRNIGESDTLASLQDSFDTEGIDYSNLHAVRCA